MARRERGWILFGFLLFCGLLAFSKAPKSGTEHIGGFNQGVSLLKHIGIALGLEDLLGKKVDLITEGSLLPFARETAEKDKILIYERAS